MRLNKFIVFSLLVLLLLDAFVLFNLNSLKKAYKSIQENEQFAEGRYKTYETEFKDIQKEIEDLDNKLDKLRDEGEEAKFFLRNKRSYEISGGRFILSYCCYGFENNSGLFGYDFLLENPPGSGNYDDFGTSSYINFPGGDFIKSFRVTDVGNLVSRPVYKVTTESEFRHTEGIVYPKNDPDYGPYYYRLYEVKEDLLDYRADIKPVLNGYKVTVISGVKGSESGRGEYILRRESTGYNVEVVKSVNETSLKDD